MKNVLLQKAIKLDSSRKKKKWWHRLVRVMAMIVVFSTTYALILPAITMDSETVCGMEAHTHGEECYTSQKVFGYLCEEEYSGALHDHDSLCYDAGGHLICPLHALAEHLHSEACYGQVPVLVCGNGHVHDADCEKGVTVWVLKGTESGDPVPVCGQEEGDSHSHTDTCYYLTQLSGTSGYTELQIPCTQGAGNGHIHTDRCYEVQSQPACGNAERILHVHGEACGDAACMLPEVTAHQHTESCLLESGTKEVLTCQLPEHVHQEACFPVEEKTGEQPEYLCGSGVHIHGTTCTGTGCSIPEHTHEAACMVAELDLAADTETPVQWERTLADAVLTGNWNEDVLSVAATQLGYSESTKNVILENGQLMGYTRYGQWYGFPYGEWCAMYASFVLEYAGVRQYPLESSVSRWIGALEAERLYYPAGTYEPKPGDLIFFDYDQRKTASEGAPELPLDPDHVGFFVQLIPETEQMGARILTIEGNVEGTVSYVTYEPDDLAIIGYGRILENPLPQELWRPANETAKLLEQLPDAEATGKALEDLNTRGEKLGFEALRQEVIARIEPILTNYETFTDAQKDWIGNVDNLYALREVCGGAQWKCLPALDADGAAVTELSAGVAEVVKGTEHGSYSQVAANNRTHSIHDGDTLRYPFTVTMESYHQDIGYGEARVKVELLLPLPEDKAVMDAAAMPWLEDSALTYEYRRINEEDVRCQVLTGYKRVTSGEDGGKVVSGSFTETVTVKILDMSHGEQAAAIISAAMEHGAWEGECETHGIPEKLTVVTESFHLYEPLSTEQQEEIYREYLEKLRGQTDPAELEKDIHDSYCAGALSDEQYAQLYQQLLQAAGLDLNAVAEPSKGDGWIWLDAESTGYSVGAVMMFRLAAMSQTPVYSAMPAAALTSLGMDSNSQIPDDGWGGETTDGETVWISKTIEGTEQENVFDITLQIITKEEINEVYKEPDMAVVVVMDISNTMTSVFSGETTVTRYDAAMDAAERFMKSFAAETDGISKLGYVAFNTHGHEVFPMQTCATTAQATNLASVMRTNTKKIMDDAAKKTDTGKYSSSHDRFTNIEAGLKMAADMLEGVDNRHKYIIFLSDGFPTTYMTASTTDGYKGYDPYTSSGSNGSNGVFYDAVMGVHCDYGTSYSDTAAIKAREMAVGLKSQGINIFSIGVDVEGQTIWEYHYDSKTRLKTASTVERRQSASYYNSTGYEIGTLHKNFANLTSLTASQEKAMAQDFKDWLKGTQTTGIGSGHYYESTDQDGLEEAYTQIFQKILQINAESSRLDWVATDPMPGQGARETETIEFIGFWDLWSEDPALVDALEGKSQDGSLYYNTATFDAGKATIKWDLKNSGYQSVSLGTNRNYMCALKYRVRLMNEKTDFVEKASYDTNDVTSLTYRVIEVENGVTRISDQKSIDFKIPKVFGYLAELRFMKVDTFDVPLAGAEFTLTHDTANCGICRGDGENSVSLPVYTAVSGQDGVVSFTNIPSGHRYILTETQPPAGYSIIHNHSYHVTVAYDALSVAVTDENGDPLEWTGNIENGMYYTLPNTGGTGTSHYMLGGLLILAAVLGYAIQLGRKRQRGGA